MSFLSNDGSEDSASGVTMVEGRRLNATVSFMDWANKRHDFVGGKRMERMGSGVSCGDSAGSGNGGIGHWLEQMQIHQGQYGVYMKHPLEGIRCENKGSPGATGEGKSLSSPVVTGERERERESLWSPVTTGEEKSLCSPGVTGESESLCSPGGTGEGKSRRLHMFDKVVTPSDVGKLNRLVIPKHHAEKYFPLDSSEKDKGLLLTFRDSAGKEWRFRYSYWSSSQSYVLTKGWSRFVREMKLHAGDVVSFHRDAHSNSNSNSNMQQHFYISWKRRAAKAALFFSPFEAKSPPLSQWMAFAPPLPVAAPPWGERLNGPPPKEAILGREPPQFMKLKAVEQPPIENVTAKPVKRVRLFGVNL